LIANALLCAPLKMTDSCLMEPKFISAAAGFMYFLCSSGADPSHSRWNYE
jgi:hypothetical protein